MTKLGFLAVAGLLAAGQAIPGDNLAAFSNLSAMGLLMLLVYLLVTKQGPKERREAQEHTELVVDKVCKQFDVTQKRQHEDNVAINQSIQSLAGNCAAHLRQQSDGEPQREG